MNTDKRGSKNVGWASPTFIGVSDAMIKVGGARPTKDRHLPMPFIRVHPWFPRALVKSLLCALCALCGSVPAFAQSRQVPAPPQSQPVILLTATIHPVSGGEIQSGYIAFNGGLITAVGEGDPPASVTGEPNTITLNAEGMHIYPGLVSPSTYLGLTEIGDIDQTNDSTELGRVKPEVRAAVAVNPDSDLIPVTRANGILSMLVMPRGGLISGRCSALRLDGWTWEDMTIDDAAGLVVNWPRTEPISSPFIQRSEEEQRKEIKEDLQSIERLFDDAAAYLAAKDADATTRTDLRYEAMRPMLSGQKPVFISANLAGQIESAVAWATRRNLKAVIVGGAQSDRCAALLQQHSIPVIITGTHRMPSRRHDDYDAAYTLPNKLYEAGVKFAIATGGEAAHERHLNHNAAIAAAYGLPREQALKSVTLSAAEIIGQGDRLGSLEVGKSATIIVTTGDPLEITSDVMVAFIDGRRIDLGNRQKSLYEKYQEKYRQLGLIK